MVQAGDLIHYLESSNCGGFLFHGDGFGGGGSSWSDDVDDSDGG